MNKKGSYMSYAINFIFPAMVFGAISGTATAIIVLLYKLCAVHIIGVSEKIYGFIGTYPFVAPVLVALMFGAAALYAFVYKKHPNLKGGGIPTSINMLRGTIRFKWIENVFGVFVMSLVSFFFGVPLGNEGPSVQMGTAIGKGSVSLFAKKHRAWSRYAMTGGACAGFSVATGSPVSGIMFALEEAHQRISPTILTVSSVSVIFAKLTSEALAPFLGISTRLFPQLTLSTIGIKNVWIPLVIGISVGLFAVVFLKYYGFISHLMKKTAKTMPMYIRVFIILSLTLVAGAVSYSFISTGHELILQLLEVKYGIVMLLMLLAVRSTLTLCANTCGITGGIFLPILALGALLSSVIATVCTSVFSLSGELYGLMLVLGICACISSMMKMPLTAVIFSLEALSCHDNILSVIIVATVSYMITELFEAKSINDSVIEHRNHQVDKNEKRVKEAFVTVMPSSFAVKKQIRDILWPRNLFVLSVKHASNEAIVDEHGSSELHEGDVLHLRYSTTDEEYTRTEIISIVGDQKFEEIETDII